VPTRHQVILEKEKRWKRRLYRLIPSYRFSNDIYEDAVKERLGVGVRWVDLGCGRNELACELAECGAFACGLDCWIHPHLVHHPSTHFLQADVGVLPFKDKSIDLFTSNVLMEHLPDPASALKEMHRSLKPGGYMIFRTPNALHVLNLMLRLIPEGLKKKMINVVFGISSEDVFPTYYRANRLNVLRKLCRAAGFNEVRIQAIEDVHTAFGIFFLLSLLYYAFVRLKPLAFLRTNFVVVAKK